MGYVDAVKAVATAAVVAVVVSVGDSDSFERVALAAVDGSNLHYVTCMSPASYHCIVSSSSFKLKHALLIMMRETTHEDASRRNRKHCYMSTDPRC